MVLFAALVAVAFVAPGVLALTVNTPSSLTTCEPTLLSWSGGTAPYYLTILPGGETSASALKTFDSTNATEYTWTVDIAADTEITIELKDSTGTIAYSDEADIAAGSDTSCVSTSVSASATAGSTSADSSATTTSGSTATSSSSGSGSTSSSTTAASTSSSSNAASRFLANYGSAGFLGLIGIVLI
ncbi:hypothetical protein J3R30DRAFT_3704774 [Lentinula aciculospora]|uniref:Uncharacterized protein n=1 Tax=Lentinula aciculospora TaxID=153920 RepID=A0A9W9A7F9_9AGAR|nr:hypothetical protein J3R30DRAFT_3704774 [Lentinula aciculospora]